MQLNDENFSIVFDNNSNTIFFKGSLRLESMNEYRKIEKFMLEVHDLKLENLNLDFTDVDFLNSSGIAMLCKFIIDIKKMDKMPVKFLGNEDILWQKKSFANLKLLWNRVDVEFRHAN